MGGFRAVLPQTAGCGWMAAGRGDSAMPYTPEALVKRAKVAAVYGWFRQRLVLFILAAMLITQFMTWQAIEKVAQGLPRDPPRCTEYDPCSVYVKGTVSLDSSSRR
jgi:hypothetical protein